jgi:D-ribose pyranase
VKKIGILNQPISTVIAGLGHTDTLVVADAGLPIPKETQRIDLALTQGIPTFLDTLRVVLSEMQIEKVIIAEEMTQVSPQVYQSIQALVGDIPLETCSHVTFKAMTTQAKAVIRTGDFIPYANIILVSGVVF